MWWRRRGITEEITLSSQRTLHGGGFYYGRVNAWFLDADSLHIAWEGFDFFKFVMYYGLAEIQE